MSEFVHDLRLRNASCVFKFKAVLVTSQSSTKNEIVPGLSEKSEKKDQNEKSKCKRKSNKLFHSLLVGCVLEIPVNSNQIVHPILDLKVSKFFFILTS